MADRDLIAGGPVAGDDNATISRVPVDYDIRVPCPPACSEVFDRVVVNRVNAGGTRVLWSLVETFTDPGPLIFQLQVGYTPANTSDDWENVGGTVTDRYCTTDPEIRVHGKVQYSFYRIKLVTANGTYYSEPVNSMGVLQPADLRIAKEIVRKQKLAFRFKRGAQQGFLLKRRWGGPPCPVCVDIATNEPKDSQCPNCLGTGFACGYFYPISCTWAEIGPVQTRTHRDTNLRGPVSDKTQKALMLATDILDEEDVFVCYASDDRYFVGGTEVISQIRGVPLIANVTLKQIPYTSPIYALPMPRDLMDTEC